MKKSLIILCIVLIAGYAGIRYWLNSEYFYDRDIINQRRIADAYVKYYGEKHVPPSSLRELVSGGFLPKKGPYREPPGFWDREVLFNEGSYQVFPPKGGDPSSLSMLGRFTENGKMEFEPGINADVRDAILRKQNHVNQ